MYKVERKSALTATTWGTTQLEWIEGYESVNAEDNIHRHLKSSKWRTEQFKSWAREPRSSGRDLPTPKFRLAACNAKLFETMQFEITKDDFLVLEEHFQLHPSTLPMMASRCGGAFAHYTELRDPAGSKSDIKKLSFVLKPPGKYQIFSHGISCTHDFDSGMTTAFMAGEDIADRTPSSEEKSVAIGPLVELITFLDAYMDHWTHPLFLPTMFLSVHLNRTRTFCARSLTGHVMALEDELGVTRVGRRDKVTNAPLRPTLMRHLSEDDPTIPRALLERGKAWALTVRVNTQSTKLMVSKVSPSWNKDSSEAILQCLQEISPLCSPLISASIAERLRANIHLARTTGCYMDSIQDRLNLQLNVLYSFIAQTDNHHAAQLAAISGRDSTSMKILAFITTIFLPGTYVATLFAMDMFDWNNNAGGGAISDRFWIYWAVSVPLTLVTIAGWAIWWNFEKKRFKGTMDRVGRDGDFIRH